MSGFFFLVKVRPHLRLGVVTLVANSDQNARTTMNYQAAGPVVELSYGNSRAHIPHRHPVLPPTDARAIAADS
jgi:hypothetical protein